MRGGIQRLQKSPLRRIIASITWPLKVKKMDWALSAPTSQVLAAHYGKATDAGDGLGTANLGLMYEAAEAVRRKITGNGEERTSAPRPNSKPRYAATQSRARMAWLVIGHCER